MKKLQIFKNKSGSTLVEVVVSLGLLSILIIFIIVIFVSALRVISGHSAIKSRNENAAGGIEKEMAGFDANDGITVTDEESGSFEIQFGDQTIHTDGTIIKGSDTSSQSTYYYFVPNN